MTIQAIGSTGIAIYIDEHDLEAVGAKAQELDLDSARPIVSTALIEAGLSTDGVMEIEAFQNGDSVLIFARILASEPLFFRFDDFEELLTAVKSLPPVPTDSTLTYLNGSYYLTIAKDEHAAASVLEEFCGRLELPASFMLHLREHGSVICAHNALGTLRQYF